jgi:hypothetical protein
MAGNKADDGLIIIIELDMVAESFKSVGMNLTCPDPLARLNTLLNDTPLERLHEDVYEVDHRTQSS